MRAEMPTVKTLCEEAQALFEVVNDQGDLPCVLVATSFLDQYLASLLSRFFIEDKIAESLLHPRGRLGTLVARTDVCYSLGLISKGLCQNLRKVGKIRNLFAHNYLSLSFDDSEVVDLCESLTFPKVVGKRTRGGTGESYEIKSASARYTEARPRFTICVALMANRLLLIGLSTKRRPRQGKGWD